MITQHQVFCVTDLFFSMTRSWGFWLCQGINGGANANCLASVAPTGPVCDCANGIFSSGACVTNSPPSGCSFCEYVDDFMNPGLCLGTFYSGFCNGMNAACP
jgi:hypothetical protein